LATGRFQSSFNKILSLFRFQLNNQQQAGNLILTGQFNGKEVKGRKGQSAGENLG
jgi:hypothetical protein